MRLKVLPFAFLFAASCGRTSVDLGGNTDRAGWLAVNYDTDAGVQAGTPEVQTLYDGGDLVLGIAVDDNSLAVAIWDNHSSDHPIRVQVCNLFNCSKTLQTVTSAAVATDPGWDFKFGGMQLSLPRIHMIVSRGETIFHGQIPGPYAIRICSTAGCPNGPRTIPVSGNLLSIAADEKYVYSLTLGGASALNVERCARAGCDVSEVLAFPDTVAAIFNGSYGFPQMKLVESAGLLFVSSAGGIARVRLDFSAPPELFYQSTTALDGLSVVGDYVYFTSSTLAGQVQRCPLDGCSQGPQTVVSGQRWPNELVSDDSDLYWVSNMSANLLNSGLPCRISDSSNPCSVKARDPSRIERISPARSFEPSIVLDNLDYYSSCPLSLNADHLFWCAQRDISSLSSTIRMMAR